MVKLVKTLFGSFSLYVACSSKVLLYVTIIFIRNLLAVCFLATTLVVDVSNTLAVLRYCLVGIKAFFNVTVIVVIIYWVYVI